MKHKINLDLTLFCFILLFDSFHSETMKIKLAAEVEALKQKKLFLRTKKYFFVHMLQAILSIFWKKVSSINGGKWSRHAYIHERHASRKIRNFDRSIAAPIHY